MSTTITYYYALTDTGSTAPGGGGWTSTALLNDGLVGDTTTGHTATDTTTYGAGCNYHEATAIVEGGVAFNCPVTLSYLRFNYSTTNHINNVESTCVVDMGDPLPAGFVVTLAGKYSADGVSWTTFSPSDLGAYAEIYLASVTVRYVVVEVTAYYQVYDQNDEIEVTAYLSDYRLTYTETAPSGTPTVTAMGACAGAQNNVAWSAVTCADSYDIERDGVVIVTANVGTSYIDSPVTIGQAYSYRVRARNSAGTGPWSAAVVYTPCNTLIAPTGTTTATVTATCEGAQATMWLNGTVSGATGYRVYMSWPGCPVATPGQLVYDGPYLPSEAESIVLEPLSYQLSYTLTVQAYNNIGNGPMGATFTFTPCQTGCECATWTEQNCR